MDWRILLVSSFLAVMVEMTTAMKADSDCYCGLAERNLRIVGGRETEVNEYPWQVLLYGNRGENYPFGFGQCNSDGFMCGGSVIADQWVLTAAHCLSLLCGLKPDGVEVHLGEHNIQDTRESKVIKMNVEQIINHPDYSGISLKNDISLLKLTNKIDFKAHPHIRPICLPTYGSKKTYKGYIATVTGWGATISSGENSSAYLKEVDLRVLSNWECRWKSILHVLAFLHVTDQVICTDTKDEGTCNGDSGGPVITKETVSNGVMPGQNYEQIGVVSWGYPGKCAQGYPGVNARVTQYLDWIQSTTEGSWMTCPRSEAHS